MRVCVTRILRRWLIHQRAVLQKYLSLKYQTYALVFKACSLSWGRAAIHFQNALEIPSLSAQNAEFSCRLPRLHIARSHFLPHGGGEAESGSAALSLAVAHMALGSSVALLQASPAEKQSWGRE